MADDKKVAYEIGADPAQFVAAMERAASATTAASAQIKQRFEGIEQAFAGVQQRLVVMAAVVGGGAFFKGAIDATNKLAGEATNLSKRLDITVDEASALNTALGDIGTDSETYVSAFDKFAKQLKTNEEGLQAMGLQTRDANGNLRDSNDLFREGLSTVGQYKPGLDQTTAAMTLFGKGVDDVMKLQRLNNQVLEDARKKNEELGLTITRENVEASKAYKAAMNDVGDVMTAVQKTIGQAVMPVFTELANYFASTGPYVVGVFKAAVSGLLLVFRGVQMGVSIMARAVFEAFNTMMESGALVGQVFSRLFSGDFGGAVEAAKAAGGRIGEGFKRMFVTNVQDAFGEAQQSFQGDMQRVWGQGTAMGKAGKGGTKRMGDFKDTNGGSAADKSRMGEWEAQLAEAKLAFQEQRNAEGSFQQYSRQAEADYWRGKLAITQQGTQENLSVRKKVAEMELDINRHLYDAEVGRLKAEAAQYQNNLQAKLEVLNREAALVSQRFGQESKEYQETQKQIVEAKRAAAAQIKAIEMGQAEAGRQARLADIALQEQAVQIEVELGVVTRTEQLAAQQQFEQRRFQIAQQSLQDRLQLALADPDQNPLEVQRIHQQIEQLEQQHQQRLAQIRGQATVESNRYITGAAQSLNNGFAQVFAQVGTQIKTISGLLKGMWDVVVQTVMQALAKMAAQWLVNLLMTKVLGKSTALSAVSDNAAKAGSGGVASMAAAPFPLNITAPLFGASMAAAAMAFAPVASAAGGFDIPAGVNPLVQAHAREMMLPEKHADVIRGLADGSVQAPARVPVELRGVSAGDFFIAARSDLIKVLQGAERDNAWRPGR